MTFSFRAGTSARCAGGTGTTGHNSPLSPGVPSGLAVGDFMLLTYNADSNTVDAGGQGTINSLTGAGWTAIGTQQSTSNSIAWAWWKIATSGDVSAGPTVDYGTTTVGSGAKASCTLSAWAGGATSSPIGVAATPTVSSTASATHVMPNVDISAEADAELVISAMMDREATMSSSYSVSSGWNIRNSSLGTAGATGGNPGACIIDSGTAQSPGIITGGTVTGGQTAQALYGYTISLKPLASTQTARPTTDITTTSWTPSTTLGPGVQQASLLADGSDTTFVTSASAPSALPWEGKLPTMTAAPDQISARIRFSAGAASGVIKVEIRQGASTSIASATTTYASAPPTGFVTLTVTLNGTQQAAITDLTDLRIRVTATAA